MKELLYQLLNSDTETELLEFKKAERQFDKDKLGRYFSALSNEANLKGEYSAYIVFGIDNDKNISGTSVSDKQLNEYKQEIANHTSPTLNFIRAERIITPKGKVIVFEIPAAPGGMPVSWKNHYYARNGESLSGLSIEKIERIRNQVQNDWSARIIPIATINDLSEEAIAKARIQYAAKNPGLREDMKNWNDATFLNKAKLTINGQITNTAILLLGKSEVEHYINPATSRISWILKDRDGIEKDYEHFNCPLFLNVNSVYAKIRNIKYRYMKEGSLFPDEVNQYESFTIREALNNCIAHQDYTLGGKINLVESEDGFLVFSNAGDFIPQSIEKVIESDAPETQYRNPFLSNAMVNLNMIDTIGSGIRKMFVIQKNKYFPLPEYDLADRKVTVTITGKVTDVNYARKLAQMPDLRLQEIVLLDKVQKNKILADTEIQTLRDKKLIEGRKPNIHISSNVARFTGEKERYIKNKGFNDDYYENLIIEYVKKFKKASNKNISELLLEKLPDILDDTQKKNKIRNLLQKLKRNGKIALDESRRWKLV